jgi:hypothetical protein
MLEKQHDNFLAMQCASEQVALSSLDNVLGEAEIIDLVHTIDGGVCVFLGGKNLNLIHKKFRQQQKKNFISSFERKSFPLDVLKVFYSLHKPQNFPCLIFADVNDIPASLELVEECLHVQANILELRSQRSFKKNSLVIGVSEELFDKTFAALKKKFKKVKFTGFKNPNASLLRFFTVLKPD